MFNLRQITAITILILFVGYIIWLFSVRYRPARIIIKKREPINLTGQLENIGYELCMLPGREQILNKRPILFPCGNSQNFIWQIIDDTYLKNVKTDLCMRPSTEPSSLNVVLDQCPSISNITPLNALDYNLDANNNGVPDTSEWDIIYRDSNTFQLKNKLSDLCLDITFNEYGPDTTQNPCLDNIDRGTSQLWRIKN